MVYSILNDQVAELASWIAVLSATILLIVYATTRRFMDQSLSASRFLLAAYCALVLLRAGYLESVPQEFGPPVALLLMMAAGIYLLMKPDNALVNGPIGWVIGLIFFANYVRLITRFEVQVVPADEILLILYSLQLYAGYYFLSKETSLMHYSSALVYSGHIAAMAASLYLLDNSFVVSISWGGLALGCLLLALKIKDRTLGQSSLLIFGISAIKIFVLDLAETTPFVRMICLGVLGFSLYLGGWLYRKIDALDLDPSSPDSAQAS